MARVAFAPLEKDKNRYNTSVLSTAVNALPLPDGWGPLKAPVSIDPVYNYLTDELGNRLLDHDGNRIITGPSGVPINGTVNIVGEVLGCVAVRKADGSERLFAGTATQLLEFNYNTYIWDDVSRISGGAYAATARWSFAKFGSKLYAQNGFDVEQKIDIENDTYFSANATAPVARYLAVVRDFLWRGNIANYPYQVQWSAFNNPEANTVTVDFSDYQDMPEGDEVMGIVPITGGAHIWMRSALHTMAVTFGNPPITRQTADTVRGTNAPYSIAIIGQDDYVIYCDDGFYRYKGGGLNPIGDGRFNKWFLTECDQQEIENMVGNVDPENAVVWWSYTDNDGARKLLGYHYLRDQFMTSDVSIQASMRARTFLYEVDGATVLEDDLPRFAAINDEGRLVYLAGENLEATIITNEISFNGTRRVFVNGVRLDSDAVNYTVTIETADYKGGDFRSRSPSAPSRRTGNASVRADGRVHRLTFIIPEGEPWTVATGADVNLASGGK